MPVVLASKSPERRRLLSRIVRRFDVVEPQVDEGGACCCADAESVAGRLAEAKAQDAARRRPDALIIAADTVVECQGEIIGKPADRDDAVRILSKLTSHPHRVVTGLCVMAPDGRRRAAVSVARIRMRKFTQQEIERYVDREDALNRAGAYALKEFDPNVLSLDGSRTAVMGLPVEMLGDIIESLYPSLGRQA